MSIIFIFGAADAYGKQRGTQFVQEPTVFHLYWVPTDRVEASPLPESLAASGVGTAKAGTKKKARKYVVKCMIICDLRDSCKDYFWSRIVKVDVEDAQY